MQEHKEKIRHSNKYCITNFFIRLNQVFYSTYTTCLLFSNNWFQRIFKKKYVYEFFLSYLQVFLWIQKQPILFLPPCVNMDLPNVFLWSLPKKYFIDLLYNTSVAYGVPLKSKTLKSLQAQCSKILKKCHLVYLKGILRGDAKKTGLTFIHIA